ncbi:SusC/RagA family TonB-linked outer membrane protein [Salegentibacter salegens]|uniref:TonB-linked outer membrane protein, SusC/RagA family n=1 Tax=Salegentibacter salegens TaxID=143223 RepID=A0A1M7MMB6_9FLAO|nr:TonB-dependent receptor [Salegentibacter salegens]PRX43238.1 TonB-linked SusC/RagA family outer membrane protein [Salegentibacter salegens]SHM92055.1 TonB-linked outer membrane protein, SusC/RagA family [Salegentibacter salegens]
MKIPLFIVIVLMFPITIVAQDEILVTGVVLDAENGMPVPSANVIEKGTSNGVLTNFDGEFSIQVPAESILVFSYIGYATKEVQVNGRTEIEVSFEPEAAALQEVIVVGYGTQRKADLTGAVSVVDMESMNRQPSPQVSEQLQGQASGVTVTSSGQPGEPPQVRIRGINTFGDSSPLYVVDGVPTQDINYLNPNDIANMQVLKDAGSASIYGARAANGVIIITTKKGSGDLKVNYNGYYGTQMVPKGNVYDILSPQGHADIRWAAMENTNPGEPITDRQYGSGAQPTLPYYILPGGASQGEVDESNYFVDPNYTESGAVNGFNQIIRANQQGTNWFQEIFNDAPIMNHDISVSQGGEKGNFLFSLNYMDQDGTLKNTFFERYTARVNSQFNISDNFRVGENIAFALSNGNRVAVTGENPINHAYRSQPIIPVYDIAGNFAGTQAPSLGNSQNAAAILERNRNNFSKTSRVFGNIFAELDFLENFTARTSFGGSYSNTNGQVFNYPTYENAENTTYNQLTENAFTGYNWTWSNTLQYQNNFNELHDVTVLVGTEAFHNQYEEVSALTQGYYSFDPDYVNLSTGAGTQTNSGFYTEDALFSVFGRLDYTFNERYLLGATLRRDATSRFTNPRDGWFPAVSAGWRISEEAFMDDVSWIDELKLRGGYGVMGNQNNVDPANAFTTYGASRVSSYYDINGSNNSILEGFLRSRIGNPNASWEKNINANIGIDVNLFNSKLQVSADYYRKDVVDLLYNPELTGTAGVSTAPYVNIAEMKNSGLDLSATAYFDFTSELQMNTTLTLTTFENEIVNIADGVSYFDQEARRFNGSSIVRNAVGHSVGQFHGYNIVGFWDSQEEVDAANQEAQNALNNPEAEYQSDIGVGRFRYEDINGDGVITSDDRTFLGNPNPDFSGGLNIEFTYKNWDFSTFLYGVYGNDIWNQVKWWHDFYSSFNGAKSNTALYDSWTPTNQNATAPIQETGGSFSTANVPNSYFVEDGSYLRVRNIQLGYSLPNTILDKVGLDRLRLYVQGANLFTITNYSGVDPELTGSATAFGIDEGAYPTPKQIILGINLSL